jgi:DNA-binding XRE family transcriptional regulator
MKAASYFYTCSAKKRKRPHSAKSSKQSAIWPITEKGDAAMNNEHKKAITQARINLADAKERGADALIHWSDIKKELFSPEELAASRLCVALMTELTRARHEQGLSQRKLEELSGVKQPVIARMENGTNSPQLDTVLKVLGALGKTLAIVPLEAS